MLTITPEVRNEMLRHALVCQPNEACGIFSSNESLTLVDTFHPMSNAADSPKLFALDGQELLELERLLDESGRTVVGVMHSHTKTSAYPSPTDSTDARGFDPRGTLHHIIVSLRHAEPVMRCFRLLGDEVTEIPIMVSEGDDGTAGDGGPVAAVVALSRPQ